MTTGHDMLSMDELTELDGEPLPFRTAMSAVIPPPTLGADPRVVAGGVDITGGALTPGTPDERSPDTGL